MTVEWVTRFLKILLVFAIAWGGIWFWNTQGCRKIPGAEMEPAYKRDSWVRIAPRVKDPETELRRGDAILYSQIIPSRRNQSEFAARVVGLPGDRVRIAKGEVFVNGEKAQENIQAALRGAEDYSEILVPRGCVFVLCDNRKVSRDCDSRGIGPVEKWAILGKVR